MIYGIQWDRNALDGNGQVQWVRCKNFKHLIKQNNSYYSIKNNFITLGKPIDKNQLKNWYFKYGVDEINILTQYLNSKEFPMTKDENEIWKTDFELNSNDIKDNIISMDIDDNKKLIKYDCERYNIYALLDEGFDVMSLKKI
ncbi:hypothetical protein [Clostridium rectalis]|uniref:hypothetical protein n=1 Tax=Clostridium rectalis TaxID=2040295 RepID=UPI000F62C3B5|nr:hypothetical protein [Clostridium rectalis]